MEIWFSWTALFSLFTLYHGGIFGLKTFLILNAVNFYYPNSNLDPEQQKIGSKHDKTMGDVPDLGTGSIYAHIMA